MTSGQETERVYSDKLQLRSSQGARVPEPARGSRLCDYDDDDDDDDFLQLRH